MRNALGVQNITILIIIITIDGQRMQQLDQKGSDNKEDSFPTSCLHYLPFSFPEVLLPDREIHDRG